MATRYAILVGINAYPGSPLKGCVRDVVEIEKRLRAMPEHVNIKKFTAECERPSEPADLLEADRLCPTYDNIVSALQQVTKCADLGDLVYIHYSGHGTTIEGDCSDLEVTTQDLALVLLDSLASTQMRYLRGLELASLLKRIVDKGVIVTMVLDCCFSGGVTRRDTMVRYMDYDPQIDATYPLDTLVTTISAPAMHPITNRGASMRANWLINPDGYTILTACGPHEVAKELVLNKSGDRHGALSYLLLRVFSKLGGVGGRQHQVYQHLHARFQELRAKGVNKQTPMLFGNKERHFFGLVVAQPDSHPISCIRRQDGSIQLEAGRAHGVSELDEFAVYPLDCATNVTASQQSRLITTVVEVGELSSTLSVADTASECIETGWMAEAMTMHALCQWPIHLQQNLPFKSAYTTALQVTRSLVVQSCNGTTPEDPCSFLSLVSSDGNLEIQDETQRSLVVIPADSIHRHAENQRLIIDTLTHLARFRLVRSLANPPSGASGTLFATSFETRLINTEGDVFMPGCRQARQPHADCSHSDCVIDVEEGEQLHLMVENRADSGGYPLYIHVYSMGHYWEIENVLRSNHEVVPCKESNNQKITGRWQKKIRITVSEDRRNGVLSHCEDIVKVFITSRPTSFASLELPELLTPLSHKVMKTTRSANSVGPSDEWAALNFRIRTRLNRISLERSSTEQQEMSL